jgi:hypothetical protein
MMRKLMYGLQPWLRARPAALGSLDDDYYCITTLADLNAVPARRTKKMRECGKLTANNHFLMKLVSERPGR